MKLIFQSSENMKEYRDVNGLHFKHGDIHEIDDELATTLLQDFKGNFMYYDPNFETGGAYRDPDNEQIKKDSRYVARVMNPIVEDKTRQAKKKRRGRPKKDA